MFDLPFKTHNAGGISNLINHKSTGILVKPNDPDEFVVAVNDLISGETNGLNLVANARNEVFNYDKSKVITQWFEFINNAIK